MPVTTFRAAAAGATKEPIRFAIAVPDGDGEREELFDVARPLPAAPFITLSLQLASATSAEEASRVEVEATARFLRSALGPVDFDRLMTSLELARFSNDDIVSLIRFIVEEDAGRPTSPPSESSDSESNSGGGSNEPAGAPAAPSPRKKKG